jgi:cytochrome P450
VSFKQIQYQGSLFCQMLIARTGRWHRFFGFISDHAPIVVLGPLALVSKYDDVCTVFSDSTHFAVPYAKSIEQTTGPFILAMGDTPKCQKLKAILQAAIHRGDECFIRDHIDQWSRDELDQGRELDVVRLARDNGARLIEHYFGVPDCGSMAQWIRDIFRHIFVNFSKNPVIREKALDAANGLNRHIDQLIAQWHDRDPTAPPATFLERILTNNAPTSEISDEVVRQLVAGTIVGAIEPAANAIAHVVDYLLDHEAALEASRDAVNNDNQGVLKKIVFEALRFYPQNPFLLRRCVRSTVVAPYTPRAKRIPLGAIVVALTSSASFDREQFIQPRTFCADRNLDDYLHYGSGMHKCIGRHLADVIVPATISAIVSRMGLRRALWPRGRMRFDGSFVGKLIVRYD